MTKRRHAIFGKNSQFPYRAFIDFNRISLLLKKIKCIKPNNKPTSQLNIEISEEVSEGSYANLEIITHSHAEFVVDFVSVMPGHAKK
ncbi:MAG: DUF3467 domain-containing protein [Ginsengibacter sp.]